MNWKFRILILNPFLFFLPHISSAIVGNSNFIDTSKMSNVCRIITRHANGTPSICTAFLIAPNLAMTAAHCISPRINWLKEKVDVKCGQSGFDKKLTRLETTMKGTPLIAEGVIFDESHRIVSHVQDDSTDQAILKLATKSSQQPIKLITSNIASIKQCWLSGYGINNQSYAGFIVSSISSIPLFQDGKLLINSFIKAHVHLDEPYIDFDKDPNAWQKARNILKNIVPNKISTAIGAPGDSGGPLICQTKNGEVGAVGVFLSVQIGSIIGRKVDDEFDWIWINSFSPINFNLLQKSKNLRGE